MRRVLCGHEQTTKVVSGSLLVLVIELAFLGVQVSPVAGDPPGALVRDVVRGSAAEEAGLLEGDLIVRADDRLIISSDALRARVLKRRPGDSLVLEIVRDGEVLEIVAVLRGTEI